MLFKFVFPPIHPKASFSIFSVSFLKLIYSGLTEYPNDCAPIVVIPFGISMVLLVLSKHNNNFLFLSHNIFPFTSNAVFSFATSISEIFINPFMSIDCISFGIIIFLMFEKKLSWLLVNEDVNVGSVKVLIFSRYSPLI